MTAFALAALLAAPAAARPLNILLVTLDAARADHVGAYGYARPTTPALDALAREGTRFERAYSPSGWTLPSLASLWTSLPAEVHGAHTGEDARLRGASTSLPASLRAAGYRTAAWADGLPSNAVFGLTGGFQVVGGTVPPDAKSLMEAAAARLPLEPFFVWVHMAETHLPHPCPAAYRERFAEGYQGPVDGYSLTHDREFLTRFEIHFNEGLPDEPPDGELSRLVREIRSSPKDLAHFVDHYDGCLSYLDEQLGRLLAALRERGLDDDTIVAVTSDHGERLPPGVGGRPPGLGHNRDLYEELLRVPLVIRHPARWRGRAVAEPVSLMDLGPTLARAAGAPAPTHGADLGPWLDGKAPPPPVAYASDFRGGGWHRALRKGDWKLLRLTGGDWRLFNVKADPDEGEDLLAKEPAVFLDLADAYLGLEADWRAEGKSRSPSERRALPRAPALR